MYSHLGNVAEKMCVEKGPSPNWLQSQVIGERGSRWADGWKPWDGNAIGTRVLEPPSPEGRLLGCLCSNRMKSNQT